MTIKAVYTVGTDTSTKPRWDGTIFLAGPIERVMDGERPTRPRWRDEAIKFLDQRPEKLVLYNPQWDKKPQGWSYDAQVGWELEAMSHAMVRLFWVARDLPWLPGLTTNIEWGKWWDSPDTVSGAPPDAMHVKYMQTLHRFEGKPWYTSLRQCCDVAVGLLPNSGPKPLVGIGGPDGPQPTYCTATGWPEPVVVKTCSCGAQITDDTRRNTRFRVTGVDPDGEFHVAVEEDTGEKWVFGDKAFDPKFLPLCVGDRFVLVQHLAASTADGKDHTCATVEAKKSL